MSADARDQSTPDLLREAATWIRKRAERATAGRYGFTSKWTKPGRMLTRITQRSRVVAEARDDGEALYDLDHLSHWHPAVALAVADWLDNAAHNWEPGDEEDLGREALAVATAYLGSRA